jgi:hypothetical protein
VGTDTRAVQASYAGNSYGPRRHGPAHGGRRCVVMASWDNTARIWSLAGALLDEI